MKRKQINRNSLVTRGMLDEAVDAILGGLDDINKGTNRRSDKVESSLGRVEVRLEGVELRLDNLEIDVSSIKNSVKGIEAELSDTPSKREFNRLKAKVDKYHPQASPS